VCENPKETADLSTTLRSPGFPVELGGVGVLHAAFLTESSTLGHVQRCAAGNPGPVEMTILLEDKIPRFQEKYEILVATDLSVR
jgi:hypothetical protein